MTTSPLRAAGLLTAAATLVLSSTTPAQAAAGDYVALGDSYSAGVGTRAKVDDCYRSPYGYPALVAQTYGLNLDYQACTGATTSSVIDSQLGTLGSGTGYVTMTIGGNDVGFSSILTECAQPGWMSDCEGAIAGGRAILRDQLPGRYDNLFGQVRTKAANAAVTVGGYPRIFNGEDCNALTFFAPDEQSSLNTATGELNTLARGKATGAGFRFIDPTGSFTGHAVCDDPEWINGLSNPVEESYHPNRAGNVGYANLFGPSVTGRTATAQRSAEPAPQQSPAQRTRAAADRVVAMRLSSPENLAKAKAAGLNPSEVRRLDAQLRSPDTTVVDKALARLRALDRRSS